MITGSNKIFVHDGREFHLQAEDLGEEAKVFEMRVYDRGTVLWQKRVSYEEIIAKDLPKLEFEQALRAKMEKTILTVEAAIAKGKIS